MKPDKKHPLCSPLLRLILCGVLAHLAAAQAQTPSGPRLRSLATTNGQWIGTAINSYWTLSDQAVYTATAQAEFNLLTAENVMKFNVTQPQQGAFSYSNGDKIVTLAQGTGAAVHGHTLIWYNPNALPAWVNSGTWTDATLTAVMYNHIDNVMAHWKGKIAIWDVVNESIADGRNNPYWWQNLRGRFSSDIWYRCIGWTYIEKAFQRARATDPNAILLYNDYGTEQINDKSNTMYQMAADFKNRGIPIDGIGFQTHLNATIPDTASIAQNFDRFAKLGLKLYVTEFDNEATGTPRGFDDQARIYYNFLDKCLRSPAFLGFQTWGFTDKYTYLGSTKYPLIFDVNYVAKPSYYAVQDAYALQTRAAITANGGFEGSLDPWTSLSGSSTLQWNTLDFHSGASSVYVSNRLSDNSGPALDVTAQILEQGAGSYYLSGWLKLAYGSGTGKIVLELSHDGGTDRLEAIGSVNTSWTKVEGWVKATWFKNLSSAVVYIETPGYTGPVTVDDIVISDGNVALNGTFDSGIAGWTNYRGGTVATAVDGAQFHYGTQGIRCYGRSSGDNGISQDILAALQAAGPGAFDVSAYLKLASGTGGTGKIGVKLTYGGADHYTEVSAHISSAQWTKVAGTMNLAWSSPLEGAVLYLNVPDTVVTFFADDVMLRK